MLQTGILFMCPIVVQPLTVPLQENIFDVHHLVDFPPWMSDYREYVCYKCIP